ncbi:MAG: polyphosphate:AMP phosphotransferase [Acutalibacteraceae bacterium]
MLEQYQKQKKRTKSEFKTAMQPLTEQLEVLQRTIQKHNIGAIVLVDGWSASGKGKLTAAMIEPLDPRNYHVISSESTASEKGEPFLKRFWKVLPQRGKFLFIERGWYRALYEDKEGGLIRRKDYESRLDSINRFERTLHDNGYVLFKFFLHIDENTQKERLSAYTADENTKWRVERRDLRQNKRYADYFEMFDRILTETDTAAAPWQVIQAADSYYATEKAFCFLTTGLQNALDEKQQSNTAIPKIIVPDRRLIKMPPLDQVPLENCNLTAEQYKMALENCRNELNILQQKFYRKKIPFIIAYEGWDAAGKGGNIKRLCQSFDPRGYEVVPIAAPTADELAHHYLWRFWIRIPKAGHIAIFDRTWYGRVLVERVEGFCTETEYRRAYDEINEFEYELAKSGCGIIKFWLQIDKDEQLKRFHDRENTPEKRWKITEEDWRNRDRWNTYETAVNEMLSKTSTQLAPWHIIESNDKRYARIKALKIVIQAMESFLEKQK